MSDLISTAPSTYTSFVGLIQAAAATQNPKVSVFPYVISQYEPGSYVLVTGIKNHRYEPESITYTMREYYDIVGCATVFTGESLSDDPTVYSTILSQTYSLFQACVMTPAISNRNVPIFGANPSALIMVPAFAEYGGVPGDMDGQGIGWSGVLEWGFSFEALVVPQ